MLSRTWSCLSPDGIHQSRWLHCVASPQIGGANRSQSYSMDQSESCTNRVHDDHEIVRGMFVRGIVPNKFFLIIPLTIIPLTKCCPALGVAFRLTAFTKAGGSIASHLRRLVALTDLKAIQWINLNHARIEFTTITKSSEECLSEESFRTNSFSLFP